MKHLKEYWSIGVGSFYRQQLEDWLKTMDVKADVVYDIGGAQGEVKSRVKSWKVGKYKVLDLPVYDLNKIWVAGDLKKADIVFCLEVFEYLIDPINALNNIKSVMMPRGGKAYVTFQFVYPHHNELEMDSLRYTESGIRNIAAKVGLGITNIWYRVDRTGYLEKFYSLDGMRRSKQYGHHDATGFIVEFTKP